MNNVPDILEEIVESLETLCETTHWEATKADDPVHLYDVLLQNSTRGVLCVVYLGEDQHKQVCRTSVSKMKFGIACSTRKDPSNLFANKYTSQGVSLLKMVEKVKSLMLGISLSNGFSECYPTFQGVKGVSLPDGVPLDAYQLEYSIWVANEPEPTTTPDPNPPIEPEPEPSP